MRNIGIGVIGTAFMGKAHSIAYSVAGTAFGGKLRPSLEILCDHRIDVAEEMAEMLMTMSYVPASSGLPQMLAHPRVWPSLG